jgi:hypothetical protein
MVVYDSFPPAKYESSFDSKAEHPSHERQHFPLDVASPECDLALGANLVGLIASMTITTAAQTHVLHVTLLLLPLSYHFHVPLEGMWSKVVIRDASALVRVFG